MEHGVVDQADSLQPGGHESHQKACAIPFPDGFQGVRVADAGILGFEAFRFNLDRASFSNTPMGTLPSDVFQ